MLFQAQHCRNISNLSKQLEKFSLVIFTTPKRRISFLPSAAYKNAVRRYSNKETELTDHLKSPENALTTGQKVKQAGKDASYMGVLLIGFGVTGALVWYVASELLFGFSSNAVYTKALKLVKNDYKAQYAVGDTMKGYGEETSRGRRRHVNFQEYIVDGVNHMRIQFYVSGKNGKATVHAEAKEITRGNFEFRYIFLEMQSFPPTEPIIIVDNR